MKTLVVLLALSSTALADSRSIALSPVPTVGQSLEAFCKQSTNAATLGVCMRNSDDSQCHDAKRWNPLGTGIVKEARIVEVHGDVSNCVPSVRTTGGWAPFIYGGMPFGRKNDGRVDRIDIVEPRNSPSFVLFRLLATRQHGGTNPADVMAASFAVCRIDDRGVACGTHSMEPGLDVKMREDGRVELMAHRDKVTPAAKPMDVSPAAQAQIGVYELR